MYPWLKIKKSNRCPVWSNHNNLYNLYICQCQSTQSTTQATAQPTTQSTKATIEHTHFFFCVDAYQHHKKFYDNHDSPPTTDPLYHQWFLIWHVLQHLFVAFQNIDPTVRVPGSIKQNRTTSKQVNIKTSQHQNRSTNPVFNTCKQIHLRLYDGTRYPMLLPLKNRPKTMKIIRPPPTSWNCQWFDQRGYHLSSHHHMLETSMAKKTQLKR